MMRRMIDGPHNAAKTSRRRREECNRSEHEGSDDADDEIVAARVA